MNYETLELTNLRLEKERLSTFPVLIQLVQNTKEMTGTTYYGTIGNYSNLAYSIELPKLPDFDKDNTSRNFVKLERALNRLKSVKLARREIFKDFYVIKITDYSSTSRSLGSYEFIPLVFFNTTNLDGNYNYLKVPQNRIGIIKNYTTKEAFILIDKGISINNKNNQFVSNDEVYGGVFNSETPFIVDIYFKRLKYNVKQPQIIKSLCNDNKSIEFKIQNFTISGPLSYRDINKIRFMWKEYLLINSSLFAQVEIVNDANETLLVNPQLTADDYFKFIYNAKYDTTNVRFDKYLPNNPESPITHELTIRYTPMLLEDTLELEPFSIILSDDIDDYKEYWIEYADQYKNIDPKLHNTREYSIYAMKNNKCGLLVNNILNLQFNQDIVLYEVYPSYNRYERFVDLVKIPYENRNSFDIHKYLLKKKIFNFDALGFFEVFCPDYGDGDIMRKMSLSNFKNPNLRDEPFYYLSFRFSNDYQTDISEDSKNLIEYSDDDIESVNAYSIYGGSYDQIINSDVIRFGDPTLNATNQYDSSVGSALSGSIYPLDGNNPRVQKVITDEEIRTYIDSEKHFMNLGFASEANKGVDLSDFRIQDGETYSVAVNNIRKKHAEVINGIYAKYSVAQSNINDIKTKLLKSVNSKETVINKSDNNLSEVITISNYFKYITIYPYEIKDNNTHEINIMVVRRNKSTGGEIVIKKEYHCQYSNLVPYIHLPLYLMLGNSEIISDRSGASYFDNSFNTDLYDYEIHLFGNLDMKVHTKCYYEEVV